MTLEATSVRTKLPPVPDSSSVAIYVSNGEWFENKLLHLTLISIYIKNGNEVMAHINSEI